MSRIDDLIRDLCPDGVEHKLLKDLVHIKNGRDFKHLKKGDIPVYGSGGIISYVNESTSEGPSVLIPRKGSLNKLYFVEGPFWTVDTIFYTEISNQLEPKYFYYYLQTLHLEKMNQAGGVPSLTQRTLNELHIPTPPILIQQEIARVLDQFTELEAELEAELDVRKQQYSHYLNHFFTTNTNTHMRTLRDVGPVRMCKRIMKNQTSRQGDVPFYKIRTFGGTADVYISRKLYNEYKKQYHFPQPGSILISAAGTIGRAVPYDGKDAYFQDSNIVWIENDETLVLNSYLFYFYKVANWKTDDGTIKRLYNDRLLNTAIPVPPLSEQHRIVDCLDKFDTLVNDLSSGLPAEIEARRKQYEYYRDRLLTFPEKK